MPSPSSEPRPDTLRPARVRTHERPAPGIHELAFEPVAPFLPGQVIGVTLFDAGPEPRLYSLAGGVDEPVLRIVFDVHPAGRLTPRLAGLAPGDDLRVTAPFGRFLGEPGPATWVAGGTGIAPFLSMLRSGLAAGKTLLHGSRTEVGFIHADLFEAALGADYIRCCSRATRPDIFAGRVTDRLSGLARLPPPPYYVCGSAEFVTAVRDALIAAGAAYERILSEIYF